MALLIQKGWLHDHGVVDILIRDGRIAEIGPDLVLDDETDPERLDASGLAVVPGLVNGHTHAAMTLFRGYGDDMHLLEWLEKRIWPAEAKLTEEDVYWGTKLACLEMIRSGTVSFQDMYWHFHGMARAVEEMGVRAGVGAVMIDVAGPDQAEQCKRDAEQMLEESSRYSDRVRFVLTPHAIYTVSPESLRWVAEFSEKNDLLTHIHLSETPTEVSQCLEQHGVRPALHLDNCGLLTPRALLAHGVHLEEDELDLIAKRGSTIVTNPVSNMKLAVGGVFPYSKAAERGIPMALGTDGAASNNSLDLFQDLKVFALIQKHADQDPTALPATDAWPVVTGAKAPLLGQSGVVAEGEKADLLLIRREEIEVTPQHDFVSNMVYVATGQVVDSTIVDGKILMRHREIAGEEEIRREASERARVICGG
ncbi:MAG: amidohydrolase [Magnetococcales bacterium]|nr:amidohydrolase [Magnetococcales bacterium]